jgi:hypothetical protein
MKNATLLLLHPWRIFKEFTFLSHVAELAKTPLWTGHQPIGDSWKDGPDAVLSANYGQTDPTIHFAFRQK